MSDIRRPAGLSRQHPEHGCTDLPRYSVPSQGLFPLFTELHTTAQRRQAACRSIRVFVTLHAGSDGNFTRQISAKFNSFRVMNRPVLLRISTQVVRQQSARHPSTILQIEVGDDANGSIYIMDYDSISVYRMNDDGEYNLHNRMELCPNTDQYVGGFFSDKHIQYNTMQKFT